MRIQGMIAAAALAVFATGCGGDDRSDSANVISCTFAGDWCDEFVGEITTQDRQDLQAACTLSGGSYAARACNRTGAVAGRCHFDEFDLDWPGVSENWIYYTNAWSTQDAQLDCSDYFGTWMN